MIGYTMLSLAQAILEGSDESGDGHAQRGLQSERALRVSAAAASYDVIVLGLGAVGSAAAYQLARRGQRVLGLDQFSPPHVRGSSHGETRITRLAIGEGAEYSPLAIRSRELWREIEAETGKQLLFPCGGLIISNRRSKPTSHGVSDLLDTSIAAARQYGIAHAVLGAEDIRRRFPQFAVEDHEQGYYEPSAGYLLVEACVAANLGLAEKHGATLRVNQKVAGFEASGARVIVTTEDGSSYEAEQLLIAAGAWLPALIGGDYRRFFTVTRQVQHWFEIASEPASFVPGTMPVFIWEQAGKAQPIYGFPASGPAAGVKIATEGRQEVDPDAVDRTESPGEVQAMYETYIKAHFPRLGPCVVRSAVCLYTVVAGGRFVIDRHPESDRITFVSACSGHGFKHSAAIGEALAEMLTGGRASSLAPFTVAGLVARGGAQSAG